MALTYRFTDRDRLDLLAAFTLDVLSEEFSESELDRDDSPPRTVLYNLAAAMEERHGKPISGHDRDAWADQLLSEVVGFDGEEGALGQAWKRVRERAER